jgi:predicted ABC-type ATPase
MFEFGSSFSFETVCSHPSKIGEIENAKKAGYKIYLYFISVIKPSINMERVGLRVERGGHAVPEDKIRARYFRTMENLYGVFSLADKAFFFDNSMSGASDAPKSNLFTLFAEKRDNTLYIPGGAVPAWFNTYLFEKLV